MISRKAKLAELKLRIAALDQERAAIAADIVKLEQEPISGEMASAPSVSDRRAVIVDQHSTIARKISLFRELFRGRADVFPIRWNNAKSGKSGYAPACHNEWQRGVCEKPRVKCSVCPNQAFMVPSRSWLEMRVA